MHYIPLEITSYFSTVLSQTQKNMKISIIYLSVFSTGKILKLNNTLEIDDNILTFLY